MPARYYVTLTDYGSSLIAQAHNVVSIQLTEMVIGDANNQPYEPIDQKSRTTLVNQRASVPIQSVEIIGQIARVSATIEAHIGGFNMHEYGFIDATGQLVYIANYHGAYKPVIAEGAGGELEIVTDIKANAGALVLVQIDPNIVTANKEWVRNQLNELKEALLEDIRVASEDVAIGDLFLTTTSFPNAEAVHEHKKFGTWQRYGDGQVLVLVANQNNNDAPTFMKIMGSSGGEYKHQLTIAELPRHRFSIDMADQDTSGGTIADGSNNGAGGTGYTNYLGDDQAHNIVQPSIVIGAWLRIA